jgi:hypothetical protein
MQAFLAGKPEATVRRALQALITPLVDHWGDMISFREAAAAVLRREAGNLLPGEKDAETVAERVWKQVRAMRGMYFRAIANVGDAEAVFKRLEKNFASAAFTQGCMWLSYRTHISGLNFLSSQEGHAAANKVLGYLDEHKDALDKQLKELENPSLADLEAFLGKVAAQAMGKPYEGAAVAGQLLEKVRAAARNPAILESITAELAENAQEIPMLNLLINPVQLAELREARGRFARMTEQEREQRYQAYRKALVTVVPQVAKYATMGFEPFCQALEARMFPYPRPIEWIRSFIKPIYANAEGSSIFDNCVTPQSIKARYQKLREEKSANIVMLELGRAFAMAKFSTRKSDELIEFIRDLDLSKEFHWPRDVQDYQLQLGGTKRA